MVQKSHNQDSYDAGTLVKVTRVDSNNTYCAVILENKDVIHRNVTSEYDHVGASYYVTAVIMIYGLSIVFMIGSLVKRSKSDVDNSVNIYLKEAGLGSANKFELRHKKARARANLANAKMPHQNVSMGLKLTSSIATVADGGKIAAFVKEGKSNYFNPCSEISRLPHTQGTPQETPSRAGCEDAFLFPKCGLEDEGGDREARTFQRQSSSSTVKLEPLFEEVEDDDDDDDLFQTEHAVLMV